jgi:hypothetical protein
MSKPAVKPVPEGMHTLTPHLVCAGAADAIKFYEKRSMPSNRWVCPVRAAS